MVVLLIMCDSLRLGCQRRFVTAGDASDVVVVVVVVVAVVEVVSLLLLHLL